MKTMGNRDNMDYGDIIRIKEFEKPYQLKVIDGPKQSSSIFYPSVDKNSGESVMAVITVADWRNNIFSELARIHKGVQAKPIYEKMGVNEESKKVVGQIKSIFEPTTRYHALVLNKYDTVPAVRRAEFAWSINKKMLELEQERFVDDNGNKNEGLLRYGLMFMLWFEVMKVYKDKKNINKIPEFMNTDYTVKVIEKDAQAFMGKIPSIFLKFSSIEVADSGKVKIVVGGKASHIDVVARGMFTEDQWQAVCNYEKGIDDFVAPMDDEAIIQKLQEYPLLINSTRDGKPMVPLYEELMKEIENKKFPFALEKTEEPLALENKKEKSEEIKETKDDLDDLEEAEIVEEKPEEKSKDSLDDLFGDESSDNSEKWSI